MAKRAHKRGSKHKAARSKARSNGMHLAKMKGLGHKAGRKGKRTSRRSKRGKRG